MKKLFFVICSTVLSLVSTSAWGEIPTGYYKNIDGKATIELKTAVKNVIYPHTMLSYNSLWYYFKSTDVHVYPNDDQWWDMYSGETFYVRNGSRGMNREHSFPKSWWGGITTVPAYTDLNHLYPSETDANLAKNNYPLGEVQQATFENGWTKVGYPKSGQGGGSSTVFEPADQYKGDFARTYFYMVTCYQDLTWKYSYMLQQNTYPTLMPWAYEMLLRWHRQDPVSQKELDRNEAVYESQNNRNPFIDYPELAEYIWGNKAGQIFYAGDSPITGDPTLLSPVAGSSLDFSEVAVNKTQTLSLLVKGENMRGNITVTIYGTNSEYFKSAVEKIPTSNVNSENGYMLNITYSPTTVGTHEAKVLLSDGGIVGSFQFSLIGAALPIPSLSKIVATEATDITETAYRANWNIPANEDVDYYVVTRTITEGGKQTVNEFVAEENYYMFDDLKAGTTHTYTVQSSRLGYRSVSSNAITVASGAVTGIAEDAGLSIMTIDGGIRLLTPQIQTHCYIYNAQGQVVAYQPQIENGTIITLPIGIYLVKTKESPTIIKVAVTK
ncbi:MAG: endonuclease [Muribaculaceae bacterium]|nr:endonuclease [Muribaculaceae bacterium]